MLVSNWIPRTVSSSDGPNTSILRVKLDDGREDMHYFINDWGTAMGRWGGIGTRSKWDCEGYKSNTVDFVRGVNENGIVGFGYKGKHISTIAGGFTLEDMRWLMTYLGGITDDQIRTGLMASGATAHEVDCFTSSVRSRIEQLRRLSGELASPPTSTVDGDSSRRRSADSFSN